MFMQNEIILSGITFDELKESFKSIVQSEVLKIFSGLAPAKEPTPEFITRKETAHILGISLPTLNEWTKNGTLPAQRIGTRVRYQRANVYASLKDVETLKYRRA
jgi:excisionase family DNA binding protein